MKKVTLKGIKRSWSEVISRLEKSNSKVAHFLEDAKVHSFDGEQVLIGLMNGHRFHLKTLEKDAKLIEEEMNDILGQEINIKFHLQDDPEERKVKAKHSKGERMKNNKLLVKPIAKSDIALELLDTKALLKVVSDRLQTVDEEFTEYREENEGKIDFYDRLSESESTIDFSKAAKLLGYDDFGRGKLFAFCREQGYLRYLPVTPSHNEPYQRYMSLFEVKIQPYTANGKEHMGTKTVFTQKGFDHIRKMLDECNNYE